jgi:hypothetical protein
MAATYVLRKGSIVPVLSVLTLGLIKYAALIYNIFNYTITTGINVTYFTADWLYLIVGICNGSGEFSSSEITRNIYYLCINVCVCVCFLCLDSPSNPRPPQ